MNNKHFDLIIIGGGPAGCLAALGALKENSSLEILILEKNEEPSHRIGEALLTGTIMTFAEAGIAKEIASMNYHHKIGATYVWGKDRKPWYVNYPGDIDGYPSEFMKDGKRCSIHVPRHIFDKQLREICKSKGIHFLYETAKDIKYTESQIVQAIILPDNSKITANYFIDTTGQFAFFSKRIVERHKLWTPKVARYAYFDNLDWKMAKENGFDLHRTNIVSDLNGWNWIIHLGEAGNNLTSVGIVTTPEIAKKITFSNCLDFFPELKKFGVLEGLKQAKNAYGEVVDKDCFHVHPDYSYRSSQLDGPNWAMAGDAALFLDPILSQGVTLACHYGFMRGKAAAYYLDGDSNQFQKNVTQNYLNEAEILKVVVGEWYNNNKAVESWRFKAQEISKHLDAFEKRDPVESFRFITNLENLRKEYAPYSDEVQSHIFDHLIGK